MGGIFGLLRRDGAPAAVEQLERMRRAMLPWGEGGQAWLDGPLGLGVAQAGGPPIFTDLRADSRPSSAVDAQDKLLFAAAGRVDNRSGLLGELRLDVPCSDAQLLRAAYRRWGEACPARIYGDWALAVWQPAERRLFVARDHFGCTALYYYAGPAVFAFASERRALLALELAPLELDELYLAQVLVSWSAHDGERTVHAALRRLPPAHTLAVTPERLERRQYWFLEQVPPLHLPSRQDYVEVFQALFDEAVRARLDGTGLTGLALSGGLDSGAVAAAAAAVLKKEGRRLPAFTSVPISDPRPFVGDRFGDELPLAQAAARFLGCVDLQPVPAAQVSPLQGLRLGLQIHSEPVVVAGQYYWLTAMLDAARAAGCRALLTGQQGNSGMSWNGYVVSQPLSYQLRSLGMRQWAVERLRRSLPQGVRLAVQRGRMNPDYWYRAFAIHPDFARRLDLAERFLADPNQAPCSDPFQQRLRNLLPGRSLGGTLWAELGAAYGLAVSDPTADARLLAFSLAVPDWVFIDPESGLDRWLVRQALQGRLPDEVRLNRLRGGQAGDLVPRLRSSAAEVDAALDELQSGPAAAYLDLPHMRQAWQVVQTQDTAEAAHLASNVLARGIMAGLFVNRLFG